MGRLGRRTKRPSPRCPRVTDATGIMPNCLDLRHPSRSVLSFAQVERNAASKVPECYSLEPLPAQDLLKF